MLNRYKWIIKFVILPVFFLVFTFMFLHKPDLSILNNDNILLSIGSDKDSGGNSDIKLLSKKSDLYKYNYTLGDQVKYPYIYFKVESSESHYLDLTDYDEIRINIGCTGTEFININFYRFIKNYTKLNNFSTYYPYIYKLSVSEDEREYIIPIDKIFTPNWWIVQNNYKDSDIPVRELRDIIYFEISNSDETPLNIENIVTINNIRFVKNKLSAILWSILTLAFYFIIITSIKLILKRNTKRNIMSGRITNETNKTGKVESYIYENYNDPLLSVTKIADDLSMSIKSVSEEINRKHKITIPVFLNLIRIEEAKKLLTGTDMRILDIAISVGYNSPGHFNRIFKKMINRTPREYRNSKG